MLIPAENIFGNYAVGPSVMHSMKPGRSFETLETFYILLPAGIYPNGMILYHIGEGAYQQQLTTKPRTRCLTKYLIPHNTCYDGCMVSKNKNNMYLLLSI